MIKGIDVAKWQGNIDWAKVKSDGITFAILKVINKSVNVEPAFETNYLGATSNNIDVGVYNYSYATTVAKAQSDAQKVVQIIKSKNIKMRVWLDVEDTCQKGLGKLLIQIIQAYQVIIENAGFEFGVYTGMSFYNTYIKPYGELKCPLWMARYGKNPDREVSSDPDFSIKPDVGTPLYAWQYSSRGKVKGISGYCDLNVLLGEEPKKEEKQTGLCGAGLADFAISKLGTPYFYGAKMQVLTKELMASMHKLYPSTVTTDYMQKACNQGQLGKENTDCSGLIGAYRGKQIGSSQLYSTAKKRLPISQVANFAVGTVLWKQGHVGVYIGGGYCVEAKGINYGTIKSKVSATKWLYGLTFDDMTYSYETTVNGMSKQVNPYPIPTVNLKKGSKGDAIKWLQFELNEAGFGLDVDGDFGVLTDKAVRQFQQSCKIEIDGIVGKQTRACLLAD